MVLGSYGQRLCLCDWVASPRRSRTDARLQRLLRARYRVEPSATVARAIDEIGEYFAHARTTFDIPLLLVGTPFQRQVWQSLLTIPYGTTLSYASQAARIGRPTAARAVASANGANALSLIVPCHRVVASDGSLGGYAGGEEAKRYLLGLERAASTHY